MDEEEKVAIIMLRVVSFLSCRDTLMSPKTIRQLVGDDQYSELTLDAIGRSLEMPPKELNPYIRRELKERIFKDEAKGYECPHCKETITSVNFVERGSFLILNGEWEQFHPLADAEFFCGECNEKLDFNNLEAHGIV